MTFHKYPKIRQLGDLENKNIFENPEDPIVIQEKVDGANFRFMIKEGKIIFGSRTQELYESKEHKYAKNFQRCIEHIKTKIMDKINEEFCNDGLIFYGENMIKHSMNYDWEKIPSFLGFDIFSIKEEKFLDLDKVLALYKKLDLSVVPVFAICKARQIKSVDDSFVLKSEYASPSSADQKAEGVVFKNYKKQIFAKYVREKFKEKNREVFGGVKKYAKTDTEFFVLQYCTNARIDKHIFKLVDEGHEINMKMMHILPINVYEDIWEENWKEIIKTKKTIDLRNFKTRISKRCLEVLKQIQINNTLK